jgi:hypothetical protein
MRLNEPVVDLALAVATPMALHGIASLAARTHGDHRPARPLVLRLLPWVAATGLYVAMLRSSGMLHQIELRRVWATDSIWHTDIGGLAARWLVPERLLEMVGSLGRVEITDDRIVGYALAVTATSIVVSAGLDRMGRHHASIRRFLTVVSLQVLACTFSLHLLVTVAFWLVHWLNFWLLFIALLFVELRRREGSSNKYQAS